MKTRADRFRSLIAMLQAQEQIAHHIGAIRAAHAINKAVREAGYDMANMMFPDQKKQTEKTRAKLEKGRT
jgi:hypothetical protein